MIVLGVFVVSVALVASLIAVTNGHPERVMDLHNSGVWVTADIKHVIARFNRNAGAVDSLMTDPGRQGQASLMEMLQDQETVVVWQKNSGRLFPVDTRNGIVDDSTEMVIDVSGRLAMGGGILAWVSAMTGEIRVVSYSPTRAVRPSDLLEEYTTAAKFDSISEADIAVDSKGRIFAATTSGDWIFIDENRRTSSGSVGSPLASVQVSVVNGVGAIADRSSGMVYFSNDTSFNLGQDTTPVLQQPGVDGDCVVVAIKSALLCLGLDGSSRKSVYELPSSGFQISGFPASPVVLGGAIMGVWPGSPGPVVQVSESTVVHEHNYQTPVFRSNYNAVILNDFTTGGLFDMADQIAISTLEEMQPLEELDPPEEVDPDPATGSVEAVNDQIWVRPGASSVLHVLDNDKNPSGGIVSITRIDNPSGLDLSISPDGQTLLFNPSAESTADVSFTYTITSRAVDSDSKDDEDNPTSAAVVTVSFRQPNENSAPFLREAAIAKPVNTVVASGSTISLTPADHWRDPDSDSLSIVSAWVGDRAIPVTGQSVIQYAAPLSESPIDEKLEYMVVDSHGGQVMGAQIVHVLGTSDVQGVSPVANPDAVRGVRGHSVTFYPLDNDQPGADPLNRQAKLAIASPIAPRMGLDVVTDLNSGAVTINSRAAGTFFLDYMVSYGSMFARGSIRVDIVDDDSLAAMPDSVVLRGTVPAIIDVLANDYDPKGSVLTVVSATSRDPSIVHAAVTRGRWLWVEATHDVTQTTSAIIDYVITAGSGETAEGQVTVVMEPALDVDLVTVVDDEVSVRAGDVTLISPLVNDTSQSGQKLVLNNNVDDMGHMGQLKVEDPSLPIDQAMVDVGFAYVDGDRIRYEAPKDLETPRRLRIEYQAGVAMGSPVTGFVWVNVVPAPTETFVNHAPNPAPIEERVIIGSTIDITVPSYGQDPDGDSVVVTGLASSPQYGQVIRWSANTLLYESYPDAPSEGFDSFTYEVLDAYGAVGIGTVRIGLVPRMDSPPPVAVADVVTAQPGSPVTIQPMTNDITPLGSGYPTLVLDSDDRRIEQVLDENDELTNTVVTRAPEADEPALTFNYHLEGNGVAGLSAQVTIRSQEGYLNPPKVYDHIARNMENGFVTVRVLDRAWDIDGPIDALHVVSVGGDGEINCNPDPATGAYNPDTCTVTIPTKNVTQVVPYVVEDADGAQAMAVIYVPMDPPRHLTLMSEGMITMERDGTIGVDLNNYIISPRGRNVYLTLPSRVWTAPSITLNAIADADDHVTLTGLNGYVGPASLTVEVRDSKESTDADAITGVISIPVQIGASQPVLYCPDQVIEVVQGGGARQLPIAEMCQIWMPDTTSAANLIFTGQWGEQADSFQSVTPNHVLGVQARSTAEAGTQSVLTIGIEGYPTVTGEIAVRVVAAPKPTVSVASVTDIQQGASVRVPVQLRSPLLDPRPIIVGTPTVVSGPSAKVSVEGMTVVVTPSPDAHGVVTINVVASDLSDSDRTDRQVQASFTVTVFGRPDAPRPPTPNAALRSKSASVSFTPGADNGSPITGYRLRWDDGTIDCGLATTCEIPGLTNGTQYRFQVQAINKAGESPWSDWSGWVTPNAVPGITRDFTCSGFGDGSIEVAWGDTDGEGSAPTLYHISVNGEVSTRAASTRTFFVSGLNNNSTYKFTLLAENQAGKSAQPVNVTCQSAGNPLWPAAAITTTATTLGETALVAVSWKPVDPNGPGPVTYQVTRTGSLVPPKVFPVTTGTSLGDNGDEIVYDGRAYVYTVVATNGAGKSSSQPGTPWDAIAPPTPWGPSATALVATGITGEVEVRVNTFPNFRDAAGWVTVLDGDKEVANLVPGRGSVKLTGYPNGVDLAFSFVACNSRSCNTPKLETLAMGPYGPLGAPSLTVSPDPEKFGGRGVCARAASPASNGTNGRPASLRITAEPGSVSTSAPTLAPTLEYCVDAGGFKKDVLFSAELVPVSGQLRGTSLATKQTGTSAMGPPEPWAPNAISLVASGNSQQLVLTIKTWPVGNGGVLHAEISYNGVTRDVEYSPGASVVLDGLPNGVKVDVSVVACAVEGGASRCSEAWTGSATPYGPWSLALVKVTPAPPATASVNKKVCATFEADPNGAMTRLVVSNSKDSTTSTKEGDRDRLTVEHCVTASSATDKVTFTARLTDIGGSRTITPASVTVDPAPDPPPMSVTLKSPIPQVLSANMDKKVCVEFEVVSPGAPAKLVVTSTNPSGTASAEKTGTFTVPLCVDAVTANRPVSFVAKLTDASSYDRHPITLPAVVINSPADPPAMSLNAPTAKIQAPGDPHTNKKVCVTVTANANTLPATLRITTTPSLGSTASSGSGALTITNWCVDAGSGNRAVKFTATMTDDSGTGRKLDPKEVSVTSPKDPAAMTLAKGVAGPFVTGKSADKRVCAAWDATPNGLAAKLSVTWTPSAPLVYGEPTDSGSSGTLHVYFCVDPGKANINVVFNATLTDESGSGRVTQTGVENGTSPEDPPGPLSIVKGTANPEASGPSNNKRVCATFTARANGGLAELVVTNNFDGISSSKQGDGDFNGSLCVDTKAAGVSVTFIAKLTDLSGFDRPSPTPSTATAASPADVPGMLVSFASSKPTGNGPNTNKEVCATFNVDPQGYSASMIIRNSVNANTATWTGSSAGSKELCINAGGPNVKVTFTATVTDTSGNGRDAKSATGTGTSARDVPKVVMARGDFWGPCDPDDPTTSPCYYVNLTLTNFSGKADCKFTINNVYPFTVTLDNGLWKSNYMGGGARGRGTWRVTCTERLTGTVYSHQITVA